MSDSRKNGKKENTNFSYSGPEEQTGGPTGNILFISSKNRNLFFDVYTVGLPHIYRTVHRH